MKTLLTAASAILLLPALSSTAWAGGHRRHRGRHGSEARPPVNTGADVNGDGRVTNYERINYERQQRFERLHGN